MAEATLSNMEFLDLLREQEIDGSIKPGMKRVLDFEVNKGRYPEKTHADVVMQFVKSPEGKIGTTIAGEIAGEGVGRKIASTAVDAANPLKKLTLAKRGVQGLGSLIGLGGGNVATQKITEPDKPIDPGETNLSVMFGLGGLGASAAINKLRFKQPEFGNFEGGRKGDFAPPIALQATERLANAGIAARLASVLKNQYFEILDGISFTVPPATGKMKSLKTTIQNFYEDQIDNWGTHVIDKMPKMHLSQLSKDLVEDAVNLVRNQSNKNFRELDELVDSGVDLSFMNKGKSVGFKEAGELLDKAGTSNFKLIRKEMKKAISEHVAGKIKQLNLKSAKDIRQAIEALKKSKSDTPENLKFITEYFKANGDAVLMTKNLKQRVDNAVMFSEKYQNKLSKTFISTLARKQPEVFLDAFLKPQGPKTLRAAMGMLTPDLRRQVRNVLIGKISKDSSGGFLQAASKLGAGGVAELSGEQLLKNIVAWEKGFGTEMSRAMFHPKGLDGLKQLAKELSVFQIEKGAKSPGSSAAFLLVPSAAMGIATGLTTGDFMDGAFLTGAGIIFIPLRYAYKFNDVNFVRRMTGLAMKSDETVKAATRRASLFVSQLAKEGIEASYVEAEQPVVSGSARHQLTQ